MSSFGSLLLAVLAVVIVVHMALTRLIAALTEMLIGLTRVILSIVLVAGLLSLATQITKPQTTEAAVRALPGSPSRASAVGRWYRQRFVSQAAAGVVRSFGCLLRDARACLRIPVRRRLATLA
ncbi:MAG: hypothetical protein HYX33_02525 [Actinobacteria bacterium]|nr:hypothetical protein [Actinomycetota bacterium]